MGSCCPASGQKVKRRLKWPSSHKVVEIQECAYHLTSAFATIFPYEMLSSRMCCNDTWYHNRSYVYPLSIFQGTHMIDIHYKCLSQKEITNSKLLQVGDYSAHRTTKKMDKKIVVRHFAPPCTSVKNPKTFSW